MMDYSIYFKSSMIPNQQITQLGEVYLPSGRIYCCDPFLSDEVNALDKTVQPGAYSVKLFIVTFSDWGKRVALAAIIFSEHKPIQWQPATYLVNGEPLSGFPVDAGLACFMDQETRQQFVQVIDNFYSESPTANYYNDVLATEFKRHADPDNPYSCGDWNLHYPRKERSENIAMFASGLGDGFYQAFWGNDFMNRPAMLVIDFGLLESQ